MPLLALTLGVFLAVSGQLSSDRTERAEAMLRRVVSADPTVRGAAKLELKASPDPDLLPLLIREIDRVDLAVLDNIIEILDAYSDERKLPGLVNALKRRHSPQLEGQLTALGKPAAEALLQSISC